MIDTVYDLPDDVKEQLDILMMNRGEKQSEKESITPPTVAVGFTPGLIWEPPSQSLSGTSGSTEPTVPTSASSLRKPLLYIAGPYSGNSLLAVEANVKRAIDTGNDFFNQGFTPFIPHLTHYWEHLHKHPYEQWLSYDLGWLAKADAMFVIADSPGVQGEIDFCIQHGIPYFRRVEDVMEWRDKVWTHPVWMNEKPLGDPRFHKLLHEIGQLHDERQAKYGSDEDPFANVRATELFGMPGYVGALVRAQDKMRRLANMVSGRIGELVEDPTRDAFLDLAVYSLIGLILWEEDNGKTD